MAKSLFLVNGSVKLIFHGDDQLATLTGLIRKYIGADCEDLFYCVLEEEKAKSAYLIDNEGDGYELIADRYLRSCTNRGKGAIMDA